MKYEEICEAITKISYDRRELTKNLAKILGEEAEEMNRGFLLKPGSPWINAHMSTNTSNMFYNPNISTNMSTNTNSVLNTNEDLKTEGNYYRKYLLVKNYCEQESTTSENILELVSKLGISWKLPYNFSSMSKPEMCTIMLDMFRPLAEQYESIQFDCANPNIELRHILNSVIIMGLGELFPKDITGMTKDKACEILTNYINIMQSRNAIILADEQ